MRLFWFRAACEPQLMRYDPKQVSWSLFQYPILCVLFLITYKGCILRFCVCLSTRCTGQTTGKDNTTTDQTTLPRKLHSTIKATKRLQPTYKLRPHAYIVVSLFCAVKVVKHCLHIYAHDNY